MGQVVSICNVFFSSSLTSSKVSSPAPSFKPKIMRLRLFSHACGLILLTYSFPLWWAWYQIYLLDYLGPNNYLSFLLGIKGSVNRSCCSPTLKCQPICEAPINPNRSKTFQIKCVLLVRVPRERHHIKCILFERAPRNRSAMDLLEYALWSPWIRWRRGRDLCSETRQPLHRTLLICQYASTKF